MMPAGEASRDAALLGYHDEDGQPGFAGALAQLSLAVGQLTEKLNAPPKPANPKIPWEACHPVWFTGQIPLTAGAGTLTNVNLYGPELPYWWDLRTITVWGFSAGVVTVYSNFTTGEQIAATPAGTPGQFTWGGQILLAPQDSLIFGATGITGVVNVTGRAIEVATAWLPEYLM